MTIIGGDNGEKYEEKDIIRIVQNGDSMEIKFAPGTKIETLSHALRLANLHLDNIIMGVEVRAKSREIKRAPVSQDLLDRIRKGRLNG